MDKAIGKFLIIFVLIAVLAAALPSSASAGVNGQQLSVRFGGTNCVQKWTVTVKGKNQSGVYTTWTKTQIPSMINLSTCEIKTSNVWWKGTVSVSARSWLGTAYSKTVNVPTVQVSNWYIVKLP